MNLVPLWDRGILGANVVVAIVDDGLDFTHPDLADKFYTHGSWNYATNSSSPLPMTDEDTHGTACAGTAAGFSNSYCGVGVAPATNVSGISVLNAATDAHQAMSFLYDNQNNHIYSASFGPTDDGLTSGQPGPLLSLALKEAITNGRSQRGSIIMWAGGNGAWFDDNTNYDGYANNPFVIPIGAYDWTEHRSVYSEPGSPLVAVAPSSGWPGYDVIAPNCPSLASSIVGCNQQFGGTSAAAPEVAGVVALLLGAYPHLTWLDVKEILIRSASMIDAGNTDWTTNGVGYHINHNYGFGKVNPSNAFELASRWNTIGNREDVDWFSRTFPGSPGVQLPISIPNGNSTGLKLKAVVNQDFRVFSAVVNIDIAHNFSGDLNITLTSPSGTLSQLVVPHGINENVTLSVSSTGERLELLAASWANMSALPISNNSVFWADPELGCDPYNNSAASQHKIVIVKRGGCNFSMKAANALNAGAVAVIIVNTDDFPINMANSLTYPIFAGSISSSVGNRLRHLLTVDPSLTLSINAESSPARQANKFNDWNFSTVRSWGEQSIGEWILSINDNYNWNDHEVDDDSGSISFWNLTLYGTNQNDQNGDQQQADASTVTTDTSTVLTDTSDTTTASVTSTVSTGRPITSLGSTTMTSDATTAETATESASGWTTLSSDAFITSSGSSSSSATSSSATSSSAISSLSSSSNSTQTSSNDTSVYTVNIPHLNWLIGFGSLTVVAVTVCIIVLGIRYSLRRKKENEIQFSQLQELEDFGVDGAGEDLE